MWDEDDMDFEKLLGKTLVDIKQVGNDELYFTTDMGEKYKMYHSQDCCESVTIDDICGDLEDLLNAPILQAEEACSRDEDPDAYDSNTWTFYKLATIKGYVTIKWHGSSNGYYSESVSFAKVA